MNICRTKEVNVNTRGKTILSIQLLTVLMLVFVFFNAFAQEGSVPYSTLTWTGFNSLYFKSKSDDLGNSNFVKYENIISHNYLSVNVLSQDKDKRKIKYLTFSMIMMFQQASVEHLPTSPNIYTEQITAGQISFGLEIIKRLNLEWALAIGVSRPAGGELLEHTGSLDEGEHTFPRIAHGIRGFTYYNLTILKPRIYHRFLNHYSISIFGGFEALRLTGSITEGLPTFYVGSEQKERNFTLVEGIEPFYGIGFEFSEFDKWVADKQFSAFIDISFHNYNQEVKEPQRYYDGKKADPFRLIGKYPFSLQLGVRFYWR